jgi:hypothetical protein
MAAWEEVFDHQVDLFTFWGTPMGQQFAEGYLQSVVEANPDDEVQVRSIFGPIATRARWLLMGADPIYVSPDMMTLVEGAARSFVPEPLHEDDLITDHGFVYLPRSLWLTDVHGKRISYRAISWKVVNYEFGWQPEGKYDLPTPEHGIYLMLYHSVLDPDDMDRDGAEIAPDFKQGAQIVNRQAGGLTLTHITPWLFGQGYPDAENDVNRKDLLDQHGPFEEPEGVVGLGGIAQFVQTLFRLMNQTITIRAEASPSRQCRKRYARAGFPDKKVVVVTLRRTREGSYQEHGDSEPVEWSHRWLVSGHWRNQWFPSLSLHRQIWISPYIKGPDEAPLVIRPLRAFKFAR